ncbi:FAD:protein FMN transferase [Massilia sp. LXY-6]|uniref:FAD:protein FMN transferase n=1 Tax=Massilia sp. LXY-6 TaxID=3379823 RepID=UPI003EDF173F
MIRRAQPWLGTLVDITVEGAPAHDVVTDAFAEVARLHRLMSFHDEASDIARINRAAPGELVQVDADTWKVLCLARQVTDLSGGTFDIACAPYLVDRRILPAPWSSKEGEYPTARLSAEVFALEGADRVRKLASGWIDVGGIAKGYTVDAAVASLESAGVSGGCVNAGGDLRVFGSMHAPVAVRSPAAPGRAARHIILRGEALATSGSYFSQRSHQARPVSALLDARDGRPLVSTSSASVRAASCAVADALTKVVLATGDCAHPALAAFGASAFLS